MPTLAASSAIWSVAGTSYITLLKLLIMAFPVPKFFHLSAKAIFTINLFPWTSLSILSSSHLLLLKDSVFIKWHGRLLCISSLKRTPLSREMFLVSAPFSWHAFCKEFMPHPSSFANNTGLCRETSLLKYLLGFLSRTILAVLERGNAMNWLWVN